MKNSRDPEKFRSIVALDLLNILGRGPGSFEIRPMPQHASMRRYYRISGPEITLDRNDGKSMVLMVLDDPSPMKKSEEITPADKETSRKHRKQTEDDLAYVNVLKHFQKAGIPVPKLHAYNIPEGLLYIEDLGDNLLEYEQAQLDESGRKEIYAKAVEHMTGIHRDATRLENPNFVGFNRAFDEKLLFLELMHYVEYAIEARKRVKVDAEDMKVIEKHMREISEELASEPRVVVHRDYQSRNILLKNGKLRIIDFQDALMGTRQYDLVSLLRDSYVVLPWEIINHCLEKYRDIIDSTEKEKLDRSHFMRIFHLQTLQRKIKDAGRFDYIDIVKNNPDFLKHIPDSIRYVKEAFEALPEHEPMRERLGKYTPELL